MGRVKGFFGNTKKGPGAAGEASSKEVSPIRPHFNQQGNHPTTIKGP